MVDKRGRVLALWRGVFGEPPPVRAEPELLIHLLVEYLPRPPPYGAPPIPTPITAAPAPACERLADRAGPGLD